MEYTFITKMFDELLVQELYDIMRLRQEVFVVEQDCVYLDADGKDQEGVHLSMYRKKELIGYVRILPPGVSYENYSSIGRVVNAISMRGKGIGHQLMTAAIKETKRLYPIAPIKISAQSHLENFYSSHGFMNTGESYLEDGIPHIGMIYNHHNH